MTRRRVRLGVVKMWSQRALLAAQFSLCRPAAADIARNVLPGSPDGWPQGSDLGHSPIPDYCMNDVATSLKKCGARVAMSVMKSWANAWTTSSRMHEAICLPCILGCDDCTDSLNHYVICDPLWSIVISCSSNQCEHLRCGPFSKLGLEASPMIWWRMLSIAFSCYHAIVVGHRDEVLSCAASGHPQKLLDRLIGYAQVFSPG